MKRYITLDSSLPVNGSMAFDPTTGEALPEVTERMCELATLYRYSGEDEWRSREEWKAEYDLLKSTHSFRDEPFFYQCRVMVGAAHEDSEQPFWLQCHPDTWAKMTNEFKEGFEVFEDKAPTGQTINFSCPAN